MHSIFTSNKLRFVSIFLKDSHNNWMCHCSDCIFTWSQIHTEFCTLWIALAGTPSLKLLALTVIILLHFRNTATCLSQIILYLLYELHKVLHHFCLHLPKVKKARKNISMFLTIFCINSSVKGTEMFHKLSIFHQFSIQIAEAAGC